MRPRRLHPVSALVAVLAMLASTSAAALALPCDQDCPEMAPVVAQTNAHACCPGSDNTAPAPGTRLQGTLPDCCAAMEACESEPLVRVDDVELVERFDGSSAPPVVALRVSAMPPRATTACGAGPAPPPTPRPPTATVVLLR